MAQQTATAADGGEGSDHPAAGIETIIVDPGDIVAALKRNYRDQDEQRSHVLRLHPPFEGEVEAKSHVSDAHKHYPPEMDPKPIHLSAEAFLVGHVAGSRHPDWGSEWNHPDRHTEKSVWRDEFDAQTDEGENRPLTDEEEDEWEEWWDTVVEMWEERVRKALDNIDELTLTSQHPDIDSTTVALKTESSE